MRAFVLVDTKGRIVQVCGAHAQRQRLIDMACQYLMGGSEYDRLGNDKDRWPIVHAQGYRVKRATVQLE